MAAGVNFGVTPRSLPHPRDNQEAAEASQTGAAAVVVLRPVHRLISRETSQMWTQLPESR